MNLELLTERTLTRAWQLAGSVVQACTYVVPVGFNAATGRSRSNETRLSVQALIGTLKPREWDLVLTQPGDEGVLLRVKELGSVTPVRGDYLVDADGARRDVQTARKAAAGGLWILYCAPGLNEDLGDLSTATASEDLGDLTAATTSEDLGGIL
jgi:hypothetical protein